MINFIKKAFSEINHFIFGNVRSFMSSRDKGLLKNNADLLNLHQGERIFIVYSGRSLNRVELSAFRSEHVMAVNLVALHHKFKELNANFYCYTASWNASQSKFLAWGLQVVYTSVNHNVKLFLNATSKYWINNFDYCGLSDYTSEFKGDTYFINAKNFILGSDHKVNCDLPKSMHGVFSRSIGIAIDLGFKQIFLIGADYSKDPLNVGHFYGSEDFETHRTENENLMHIGIKSFAEKKGVQIVNVIEDGQYSPIYDSNHIDEVYTICR